MRSAFDRRIVPEQVLELIRACQRRVPCHLGGGAALGGAHLAHRLSADVDMFCHEAEQVRILSREIGSIGQEAKVGLSVLRDAGTFVRCGVSGLTEPLEIDFLHEPLPDLEPARPLEGVSVESFADLRASKITCLLSRSEPRDLVDVLFLERAGYPIEPDLPLARRKDGGIDPGVLAWLLHSFPTRPLPKMLEPLNEEELRRFRDDLAGRLKLAARPT